MAPGLRETLRSSPNICSTGRQCFLLWDESHTNITLTSALLSLIGLACGGWHKSFSLNKDSSNTDGQIRYVEKLHDGVLNVSVFDCMNHLLICVRVLAAMKPTQWKIQQEHNEDISHERIRLTIWSLSLFPCVCVWRKIASGVWYGEKIRHRWCSLFFLMSLTGWLQRLILRC